MARSRALVSVVEPRKRLNKKARLLFLMVVLSLLSLESFGQRCDLE